MPVRGKWLPTLALALTATVMLGAEVTTAWSRMGGTVEVHMRHSRFVPDEFSFQSGQTVTFTITNHDPIDHEFILGDQAVQDRHEGGNEPFHHAIPTEVTVPAGQTVSTSITFTEPGELIIGCHLPGHYAYGMKAGVTVR